MKKLMVFGISFASCMVVFLMTIFIFKEPITNYLVSNNNLKLVGVLYGKNTLYDVVARNNYISYKKDTQTGKTDFSVTSETPGISGNAQESKRIELKEKEELLELVNKLDVKTPEVVAAILNGDKITANMLVSPQPVEQLPESSTTESENDM